MKIYADINSAGENHITVTFSGEGVHDLTEQWFETLISNLNEPVGYAAGINGCNKDRTTADFDRAKVPPGTPLFVSSDREQQLEEVLTDVLRHLRENFKDDDSFWVCRAREVLVNRP